MVNRARPPERPYGRPPTQPPRSRPPRAPRNRAGELVAIGVVAGLVLLTGLGAMLWAVDNRIAFGPTPTPTPTVAPTGTPTVDFRATQVAEDFLTQVAYELALLRRGTLTPIPPDTVVTPTVDAIPQPPADEATPSPTPTLSSIMLPGIGAPGPIDTPTPTPEGEPSDGDDGSVVVLPIISESPLATPTETPTATATDLPTPEPTATPTEAPPTPTPVPTATPLPYLVGSLRATVVDGGAQVHVGPSSIYTATGTLPGGSSVNLLGRIPSGEWVYLCCYDGQPVWARQAFVPPSGNELSPGAPEGANPNDVRWLAVQQPASSLPPIAVPTPPPAGEFPMLGYTRSGSGRVPSLPEPPLNNLWSGISQAGGALTSPAIILGDSVLVASEDGHLYSFDRNNGNQRWRYNLGATVRVAPVVHEREIFLVDDSFRMHAFEDRGNEAVRIWDRVNDRPAVSALTAYSNSVFVVIGDGPASMLQEIHRDNGEVRGNVGGSTATIRFPVIGSQIIYLADGTLRAMDVFNRSQVWQRTDPSNFQTNPVYAAPGVRGLAELYVLDGNNRIWSLDANTGREFWNFDNGEPARSMGVTPAALLVAGDGYLKAIARDAPSQLWRTPLTGAVLGIPLNDGRRALVVTSAGNVQLIDLETGSIVTSALIGAQAGAAPATDGRHIFVPGVDGRLYALLGN